MSSWAFGQQHRRIIALFALLVAFAAVLSIAVPAGQYPETRSLEGEWRAVLVTPEGDTPIALTLPGSFKPQGINPNARVRAVRDVPLPASTTNFALWVENPQHALRVSWDGQRLADFGDLDRTGASAGVDGPALVVLPLDRAGGTHQLTLEVRGDFGRGGLPGIIRVGPLTEILDFIGQYEATKIGFAVGFSLIALVNLGIAAGRVARPLHLLFGLLVLSTGLYAYEHSALSLLVAADPVVRWRARRIAEGMIGAFAILFTGRFSLGQNTRMQLLVASVAGISAVVGALGPIPLLFPTEMLQDAIIVGVIPWMCVLLVQAARREVPGAALLAASLLPPFLGAIHEVTVTHGLTPGGSWLYASVCIFFCGASLAVFMRDAADSDRHQRLVTGSPDAMVVVDHDGRLLEANPAANDLLGREAVSEQLQLLVAERDRRLLRAHLERARTVPDRAEFRLLLGGNRPVIVESVATPLDERTALMVLRDVTRRRRIDEGLLQAARVETAALLTGGIAHDFNNLLGTLLGHVGLLRATSVDPGAHNRLARMEDAIERASVLARRLLAIGGRPDAALAAVDIGEVVRQAVDLVEPTLPARIKLTCEVEPNLAKALGVEQDLQHVVVNLIVNARDALSGPGNIHVRAMAFRVHGGGPRGLLIVVDDDGPGVPQYLQDDVWQPFFTTKGPKRGTGLGLAVASQILRDHHGRIWYETRPTGGARFLVALREASAEISAPPTSKSGSLICVVDDEDAVRQVFVSALERAGHRTQAFANGEDADLWLTQHRPDVLLTDVVMPGMDGLTLVQRARTLYPGLPVAVVSGFIPTSDLSALDGGPVEQLDKPVRAQRVVDSIGRLLARAEAGPSLSDSDHDIPTGVHYAPLEGIDGEALGLR